MECIAEANWWPIIIASVWMGVGALFSQFGMKQKVFGPFVGVLAIFIWPLFIFIALLMMIFHIKGKPNG